MSCHSYSKYMEYYVCITSDIKDLLSLLIQTCQISCLCHLCQSRHLICPFYATPDMFRTHQSYENLSVSFQTYVTYCLCHSRHDTTTPPCLHSPVLPGNQLVSLPPDHVTQRPKTKLPVWPSTRLMKHDIQDQIFLFWIFSFLKTLSVLKPKGVIFFVLFNAYSCPTCTLGLRVCDTAALSGQ